MAYKQLLKANYDIQTKCDAFFTGNRIEVTNDGSHILCECGDSVGVVRISDGEITGRIECSEDQVTAIALSPNDSCIVIALKSSNIQQYQWPSLTLERSFKSYHKGPVNCLTWDSSSTLLMTGGADSTARVWDLSQKFCTHSLKATGVFRVVLFDHALASRPYAYGCAGSCIYRWKLEAGASHLINTYEEHHGQVTALHLGHDGTKLISAGSDRVIILWTVEGTSLRVLPVLDSISSLLLKPLSTSFPNALDDDIIYAMVVGDKGVLSVWDVAGGKEVWRGTEPLLSPPDQEGVTLVPQIQYSKNLKSVICTTYDNSIIFAHTQNMNVWKQLSGHNEQILDCLFVGEGDSHLVVATNSLQLRLYDRKNKNCYFIRGHTALPLSLTRHSKIPNIFASSSHDNSIRVWKLQDQGTVVCIAQATGHLQSVGCVAFGEGFLVSGSKDLCLKKWTFSEDLINTNSSKPVNLSCSHTSMDHNKDINSVCVAVNNKVIASASQDRTAKIWDASNLSVQGVLKGHKRGIWCIQFSPADEIVATASADAEIKIWSLSDYSNIKTLQEHGAGVLRLVWLNHGLQIMSSASDGLVKLWTLKSGLCVQTWDEHQDKAWALAMTSEDDVMVTGGDDATLVWWKDVTKEEEDNRLAEASKLALEGQTLMNLIQQGQWTKALAIALRLNQPHRTLKIIKEILDDTPEELIDVLNKLREDQISSLLKYCVQWNTRTKSSREAQSIVNILLREKSPKELESIPEWKTILEGLLPYTERHYKRVSALTQASSILNFITAHISIGFNSIPTNIGDISLFNDKISKSELTSDDEGVIENEENSDVSDDELRLQVQGSIMEVDEVVKDEENELDYDTGLNNRDTVEGLENGYQIERIVADSSDEEEMSSLLERNEVNPTKPKYNHFSADQLFLPDNNKKKTLNNNAKPKFRNSGNFKKRKNKT